MRTAYHYTRPSSWKGIQESGFLEPRTKLIDEGLHIVLGLEIPDIPYEKFTFAFLDDGEPSSWKQSGQLDALIENRIYSTKVVLLSFPLNGERVYVVDRSLFTKIDREGNGLIEALRRYHRSLIPLEDYRDDYEIPELLIAERIPVQKIVVEKTFEPTRRMIFY